MPFRKEVRRLDKQVDAQGNIIGYIVGFLYGKVDERGQWQHDPTYLEFTITDVRAPLTPAELKRRIDAFLNEINNPDAPPEEQVTRKKALRQAIEQQMQATRFVPIPEFIGEHEDEVESEEGTSDETNAG